MYVPLNAATAARAAIVLVASRPWQPIVLDVADLPDAARARQEGERYRATDRQQLGWPNDRHARGLAGRACVAFASATKARGGEAAIGRALKVDRPPRAVAARAVDVEFQAVPADVANRLKWKLTEHGATVTPHDGVGLVHACASKVRRADAQQCMQSDCTRGLPSPIPSGLRLPQSDATSSACADATLIS